MGLAYGYWGEAAMMSAVYGASAMSMLYPSVGDSGYARDYKDAEVAAGNNSTSKSSGYEVPVGGGGTTATFNINGKTINFGHGGRHLEGLNMSVAEINAAIAQQASGYYVPVNQFAKGYITLEGKPVQFNMYGRSGDVINVGTYYFIK
jgi:hypothetical protein